MKTLLLDVDGVIADCQTPIRDFAQDLFGRSFPPVDEWRHFEFPPSLGLTPEEGERFHKEALTEFDPTLIKLYPGAAQAVEELKKRAHVVFVTSHWKGMPDWIPTRDRLLAQFECDIVYTHAKHRVKGDFLVDDKLTTLEQRGTWKPVCFHRPWNMFGRWPGLTVIGGLSELWPLLKDEL